MPFDLASLALPAAAGLIGGAMNALAGGGTFATMPTLIALGLPSPIANATSNVALQPGAAMSAWTYRNQLEPIGELSVGTLVAITFFGGIIGSMLLVATPTHVFDIIIPWLLLLATTVLMFGRRASEALRQRVSIGIGTFVVAQILLALYGGYFGGGVGLMMTALYGLLAGIEPHRLAGQRTLQLATANTAASIVFILFGMVRWPQAIPMLTGALVGGWAGAKLGLVLPPIVIRTWTIAVTAATTIVFFMRAYG